MKIKEVISKEDIRNFLEMPEKIYKNDPKWIRPLNKDIEDVFDSKKNKLFKTGKCKRWLLYNDQNETIGRIAAFVNKKYKQEQPTGGIGFFEVIEDEQAAHFLLDHCHEWLKGEGMEAMDGPINFGERDRWWGLVTKGFYEPLYCMNYNPPYYRDFFESYGFQVYFNQLCFGMKVSNDFSEKFKSRHEALLENKDLSVRHVKKDNLTKFARDFSTVYNKAWAQHGEGKTMDERMAIKIFQSMKPVMDEKISWFVYEKEEPVACWINLPDLNFYFKSLNGKFSLFHKLKFLWLKHTKPCPRFVGIVFGIVPKWQGTGMDAFMVMEAAKYFLPITAYKQYEMQWIGDFNPKMLNIAYGLGAEVSRTLSTYRFLFDREKEFKRHPYL